MTAARAAGNLILITEKVAMSWTETPYASSLYRQFLTHSIVGGGKSEVRSRHVSDTASPSLLSPRSYADNLAV